MSSEMFIIMLTMPPMSNDASVIKYPCNNHNIFVNKIKTSVDKDTSLTFLSCMFYAIEEAFELYLRWVQG